MRRTKIVCTLGPASDSAEVIRALIRAGVDVARINFSHGDHSAHAMHIERVRRIAREENSNVAVLADLQGPKIRVGNFSNGSATLATGDAFILTTRPVDGDSKIAHVDFPDLSRVVQPGSRILLSDGSIELQVEASNETDVITQVVNGGELSSHKGVNLPGASLAIAPITEKDRADVKFAVEQDVDYVAQSFVRRAEDVLEMKQLLAEHNAKIPIIAKIEKREAIEQMDEILKVCDGVMVARGDLGVEAPPEQVPLYQKTIIHKANAAGKPVITATQMLESMIEHPRPTRAEASDVANAILDGTDAVMLSEETAVGKFPVEAVQTMARIAETAEQSVEFKAWADQASAVSITDAIGHATCEIARQLNAQVIITSTSTGFTARMVSRHRPRTPIFAVTSSGRTHSQLALVWGVQSAVVERAGMTDAMIATSLNAAFSRRVVKQGDLVVITAGVPTGTPGRTNMIQVHVV